MWEDFKFWLEDAYFGLLILGLVCVGILLIYVASKVGEGSRDQAYIVWCRLNPPVQITRQEFGSLLDQGILPGQARTTDDNGSTATGLAIGLSMQGARKP